MPDARSAPLVVAIDGPAGGGKSTVARAVADALGWAYLDSGAMYRAVARRALDLGVPLGEPRRVAEVARRAAIHLDPKTGHVRIDGADVTDRIRTPEVNAAVSGVSEIGAVREVMVAHQRRFAEENGRIVAEGRDIGTVVFPRAVVKVYLDADVEVRVRRRVEEMRRRDASLDPSAVRRALEERDRRDQERDLAPLHVAADAVRLDSTAMSPAAVVDAVLALVRSRVPPVAAR